MASFLRKLLGQEQDYVAPPLPPGEQVQQTYAAAMMMGRARVGMGAQVGVCNDHLALSPMNVTGAQRMLGLGARAVGIPGFGGVNYLINQAKPDPQLIPYSDITAVTPGSGPGLFSPPTVRIQTTQGSHEVGVTGNLWALNRSQQALQARNQLLADLAARSA